MTTATRRSLPVLVGATLALGLALAAWAQGDLRAPLAAPLNRSWLSLRPT